MELSKSERMATELLDRVRRNIRIIQAGLGLRSKEMSKRLGLVYCTYWHKGKCLSQTLDVNFLSKIAETADISLENLLCSEIEIRAKREVEFGPQLVQEDIGIKIENFRRRNTKNQCSGTIEFAQLLSKRLEGKKLKDVAKAARMHSSSLSLIKTGRRGVSIRTARRLAKALNENPADLTKETEELILASQGMQVNPNLNWKSELAHRLVAARGIETQAQLAHRSRVSDRTISMIEQMKIERPPRNTIVIRLAVATGSDSADWLACIGRTI